MSLAKDFARLINCEKDDINEPKLCNCLSCEKINNKKQRNKKEGSGSKKEQPARVFKHRGFFSHLLSYN